MSEDTILIFKDKSTLLEAVKLKFDTEGVGAYTAIIIEGQWRF